MEQKKGNEPRYNLFGRTNLILLVIALVLIIVGFILMAGGKSADGVSFNPDIFSPRRIRVAPALAFVGFILMIFAIMIPNRHKGEK